MGGVRRETQVLRVPGLGPCVWFHPLLAPPISGVKGGPACCPITFIHSLGFGNFFSVFSLFFFFVFCLFVRTLTWTAARTALVIRMEAGSLGKHLYTLAVPENARLHTHQHT